MSIKRTDEQCARCNEYLGTNNTSPDRLCGLCQRELNPHQSTARYKEWVQGGRLRVVSRTGAQATSLHVSQRRIKKPKREHGLPDVGKLPAYYLLECVKELHRREGEAKAVLKALGKLP